jgi:methyl-accepting chemotaxis protein
MTWLIAEILVALALAAMLGGLVGWLLSGLRQSPSPSSRPAPPATGHAPAPVAPAHPTDPDQSLLMRERDRILAERDRLAAERDRIAAERDGLVRERDALSRERDSLADELGETRGLVTRLERIIEADSGTGWRR